MANKTRKGRKGGAAAGGAAAEGAAVNTTNPRTRRSRSTRRSTRRSGSRSRSRSRNRLEKNALYETIAKNILNIMGEPHRIDYVERLKEAIKYVPGFLQEYYSYDKLPDREEKIRAMMIRDPS